MSKAKQAKLEEAIEYVKQWLWESEKYNQKRSSRGMTWEREQVYDTGQMIVSFLLSREISPNEIREKIKEARKLLNEYENGKDTNDIIAIGQTDMQLLIFVGSELKPLLDALEERTYQLMVHSDLGAEAHMELCKYKEQIEAGTRELRRYVEGNGFTWCDEESTVFNVTTAIGWMGGAIEALKEQVAKLEKTYETCSICGQKVDTEHAIDCEFGGLVRNYKMRYENEEKQLGSLLAVIHRDGGHYQAQYGTQKAVDDAMRLSAERAQRLDELDNRNDRLAQECNMRLEKQREAEKKVDELQLEIDELKAQRKMIANWSDNQRRFLDKGGYSMIDAKSSSRRIFMRIAQECGMTKEEMNKEKAE